ncbi:uncharacterized protein LOC123315105 [Coccinella septempunctata]|uniref:uncharacterized protein LOC123315105 n=1 Tax=Coccinella septempunctata TaxID=41139 RepID=UPI001D083421|nr:uncharacterized protein LOC123315105 [Coccinella septempunctata]
MASEIHSDTLTFDKALRILSPTLNAQNLYKLLTYIRKSVEWPKHKRNILKIHKSGCIKKILGCLTSSQSNIIAVSLSILGNCCLEPNCSNEVAFIGLNDLHNLLQRFSKEDGVNGRVFRIIGNICQHYIADYILKTKSHILTYILNFIQNYVDNNYTKFSEATLLMAVRATSKFLNRNSLCALVDKYDMLKPIGALFIHCCIRWTAEKKDKAILDQIIKFLYILSKYKYSPGISQLRNTSKGDVFMYFSHVLPVAPQMIVNIVMNFIPASTLKSELPVPDITAGFVKLLKEASSNKDAIKKEHKDYIKCLCFLLDAPINRDPERCEDAIPQLIRTLDDVQDENNDMIEISCVILETFERCIYHQNILKQQLKHDIIEVLINKLEKLLGSRKYLKIKHKLERKKDNNDSIASNRKRFWDSLPDSSDEEIDIPNIALPPFRPSSPGTGSESEMITSPWASPRAPTPPGETSTFYLQESDSEDYSPVCSENEDNDYEVPQMIQGENDDFNEIGKKSDTFDILENIEKISEEDLKFRLIYHSLSLIRIYGNIYPLPSQLCSDSLIMILVKCACYFGRESRATTLAKTVIMKILSVNENLIPMMQSDVIYAIFSLNKTDHGSDCEICSHFQLVGEQVLGKFTVLIESGCGKGDIANRLICGNEEQKKQIAMAIPYIVGCKTTLHTLMIKYEGMKILSDCLKDEKLREKCLEVLCVLEIKHLNMLSPCQRGLFKEKMFIGNYELPEDCKNVVTFVLDDNSCLSADRDALCEKSYFFNTLLNGSFKESNEEYVKLKQTNYRSLKCLVYLLNCDLDMAEPKDIQLETHIILDIITLCHRYLLDELCLYLTICVKQFCLSAENIPIIYKWSLESNTNILRLETVTFALKEAANHCNKMSVFMKLFDLGFTELLVEDIEKLISSYISSFRHKK